MYVRARRWKPEIATPNGRMPEKYESYSILFFEDLTLFSKRDRRIERNIRRFVRQHKKEMPLTQIEEEQGPLSETSNHKASKQL